MVIVKATKEPKVKLTVKVKEIVFHTNFIGRVNPVIKIFENKNARKFGINAVVNKTITELLKFKVGKGSLLTLMIDPQNGETEITKMKPSKEPSYPQKNCRTCGTLFANGHVEDHEYELFCPNRYCPATSRGAIYQLYKIASDGLENAPKEEYLDMFLSHFVTGFDSDADVANLGELKLLLENVPNWEVSSRRDQWLMVHGSNLGETLFEIETIIGKYLKEPIKKANHFWAIINFPLKKNDLNQLYEANILPDLMVQSPGYLQSKLGSNKQIMRSIDVNMEVIIFLLNMFIDFGTIEWKE